MWKNIIQKERQSTNIIQFLGCERTKTEETRTQRETSNFYDKSFIEPNPKLFVLKQ